MQILTQTENLQPIYHSIFYPAKEKCVDLKWQFCLWLFLMVLVLLKKHFCVVWRCTAGFICLEAAQSEKPKDTETPQSYRNT